MKKSSVLPKFFAGANTPKGFCSRFEYLYDPKDGWFAYILKGGPGTGKSSLIKDLAEKAEKKGIKTEMIPCASDPNSLDAVVFPELKKCVVDGTAPHMIDPLFPGSVDKIINLGDCWNEKTLLKSREEILKLSGENSAFHQKSKKFMKAFGNVNAYTTDIISNCVLREKLEKFSLKKAKKLFKSKLEKEAREVIRFISSVTPDGYLCYKENLEAFPGESRVILDEHGIAGSKILKIFRQKALSQGYNLITCLSPLEPSRLQALFVEELGLNFLVLTHKEARELPEKLIYRKVSTSKFLNKELLSSHKNILRFNKKVENEFLKEAVKALETAREIHDKLEKIYVKAMNYKKADKFAEGIAKEIL